MLFLRRLVVTFHSVYPYEIMIIQTPSGDLITIEIGKYDKK